MELRDYLSVIRGRARLIIACALIVTVTTLVVSLLRDPVYRGTAEVLVSEQTTGAALLGQLSQFSNVPERYLQTQVNVMQMPSLLDKVIEDERLQTTVEGLRKRLKVTGITQTSLITIEVDDKTASRAAATANAIAEAYVEWSRDYKRSSIRAAAIEVELRLAEMETAIEAMRREASAAGDTVGQTEVEAAIGRYSALADQLEQLRINEQLEIGSGTVLSRAQVDRDKVAPTPIPNAALALVIGTLLGAGIAFAADYLDNTIKSVDQAAQLYGAPVLGKIPPEILHAEEARWLSVLEDPLGRTAEAYRQLRYGLDFVNFERAMKTLVVTSAAPDEGKSTVAANLAAILAQAGKKTVFIQCDFRRPTTEKFFEATQRFGLSDVLAGTLDIDDALLRQPRQQNLWVLSAGDMPPNPGELLGSATMERLIAGLAEWADWIIVDTPPLLAVSDAAAATSWADGVLLVAVVGSTTREAAKQSREILQGVGARLVGVVVRGIKRDLEPHGSYYGYYNGHSPSHAE